MKIITLYFLSFVQFKDSHLLIYRVHLYDSIDSRPSNLMKMSIFRDFLSFLKE